MVPQSMKSILNQNNLSRLLSSACILEPSVNIRTQKAQSQFERIAGKLFGEKRQFTPAPPVKLYNSSTDLAATDPAS